MSHHHGNPSLNEIELPESGHVNFWVGETQYSIRAHNPTAWAILQAVGGRTMPIIGDFVKRADVYEVEEYDRYVPIGDDWREAVRHIIR